MGSDSGASSTDNLTNATTLTFAGTAEAGATVEILVGGASRASPIKLNSLARKGVVVRTRGGAAPAFHPAIVERQNQRVEEKNRIAQAAAALVEDGDTIMIEAGTTTALIAKYLLGKRFVNIVTNSTLILPFARLNPGIHLTVVGGEFRPATESFVGPVALGELERFHVRLAFVGTDGFSLAGGLTTHLVEGAEIVRKMADRAETTILVADSAKFGRIGFVHVLPVSRLQRLISDAATKACTLYHTQAQRGDKEAEEKESRVNEAAAIGVLSTMEEPTKPMRAEAASGGSYTSPWGVHPKLQILTVGELLDGKKIDMPPVHQVNVTYKRAPKRKKRSEDRYP